MGRLVRATGEDQRKNDLNNGRLSLHPYAAIGSPRNAIEQREHLFTDVFRLSEMRGRNTFCHTMKPSAGDKESGENNAERLRWVQFRALRQRTPSRDLLLVRWAAWAVIAAFIGLVILVIWGLATHEPSQFPLDGD